MYPFAHHKHSQTTHPAIHGGYQDATVPAEDDVARASFSSWTHRSSKNRQPDRSLHHKWVSWILRKFWPASRSKPFFATVAWGWVKDKFPRSVPKILVSFFLIGFGSFFWSFLQRFFFGRGDFWWSSKPACLKIW